MADDNKKDGWIISDGLSEGELWADRYPELGTGTISYEDMISPEIFALEREAVWRKCWLYVGREEDCRNNGEYFTREFEVLKASVIVVRGKDGKVRAFHNVCPHRGNKLVWEDNPRNEVHGKGQVFFCKYHGISFAMDGSLVKLPHNQNWHGDQGCNLQLAEIPLESCNGFMFINFNKGGPEQSLREYLGDYLFNGLQGYPFEKFTERNFMRGNSNCNWKALQDAFSEAWHGLTLHSQGFPMLQTDSITLQSLHYSFHGPHKVWITGNIPEGFTNFDIERIANMNVLGPNEVGERYPLPPAAVPIAGAEWGTVTISIFPNMQLQWYAPGWWHTYNYMPSAYNKMRFEIDQRFQPAKNFSELFSHKAGIDEISFALLQDVNTLEATQMGLEARAFEQWPLIDEEIIIRHFHREMRNRVEQYQRDTKL